MWSEDNYSGPPYFFHCRGNHEEEDACIVWCYRCGIYHDNRDSCRVHAPQLHQHQEDSSAIMAERRSIMEDIEVCAKFLSIAAQFSQEDSATGREYVREMMETIKKRIDKLPTEGESSIQEPQEEPLTHDSEPHIEPSSSPPQVEEEILEPSEDCSVQEPLLDSTIYEDSDSDSDWGGPVCPRWEDLPYCEPRPQVSSHPWHEWEDTGIGNLWCADDEAGETLVLSDIGDEQLPISFSMGDSIDHPYAIVKELEVSKCGGVDELHESFDEHLAPMRYYWDEFMEKDAFEPSGTWWKLIKKINCKMKRVSFYISPPSAQHRGAREVLEKKWWKKKKWRDKAVSTFPFG